MGNENDMNDMNDDKENDNDLDNADYNDRINPKNGICCLCDRMLPLTWHHLIPKCTHEWYIKLHPEISQDFLNKHGIWICRQCHSGIHDLYTNDELAETYFTLDLLLESDKVQKWIKYASKQKRYGIKIDPRAVKKKI